jgi:hypothetical protein
VIYPAEHDITILQNATWSGTFRATQQLQQLSSITIDAGEPTFTAPCHGLVAGDKVVFTGGTTLPCGFVLNVVYFVISANLTTNSFKISATSGGSSLIVSGTAVGTFKVAKPLDITGYTLDADIKDLTTLVQVATFTVTVITAADGLFRLSLTPTTTVALAVKDYGYDISLTAGAGERYYWVQGTASVEITYSRT